MSEIVDYVLARDLENPENGSVLQRSIVKGFFSERKPVLYKGVSYFIGSIIEDGRACSLVKINKTEGGEEYTGMSVDYYKVPIENPTTQRTEPYVAECNDIIEALDMNYAEGNQFKSIWRRCAARKLGKKKKGYGGGLYDAEKGVFFAERVLLQAQEEEKQK